VGTYYRVRGGRGKSMMKEVSCRIFPQFYRNLGLVGRALDVCLFLCDDLYVRSRSPYREE